MDDLETSTCPKCGQEQPDHDGFGVVHCEACGYCQHPYATGEPLTCGICGKVIENRGEK